MTWREERDALIAQTIAFVESVTGKPPDFAQFTPLSKHPSQLPQSSAVPQANPPVQPVVEMVASLSVGGDKTPPLDGNPPSPGIVAEKIATEAGTARASDTVNSESRNSEPRGSGAREQEPASPPATKTAFASELFRRHPSANIAAPLDWRRDMQTEICARIASFRAHQERFNRERQEYFSTTLARLRASAPKPPRTDD